MTKHTVFAIALALCGAVNSRAGFIDYYGFPYLAGTTHYFYIVQGSGHRTQQANNWSIVTDLTWVPRGIAQPEVDATPLQLSLDSGEIANTPGNIDSHTNLMVLTTAPESGFWSFDFTLGLRMTSNGLSYGAYVINGTETALAAGSGTVSNLFLNAGDVFGFRIFAEQFATSLPGGFAGLTVTNFSAPVPEPTTIALLVLGIGALQLLYRRRRAERI